jgi:hypothetical protein
MQRFLLFVHNVHFILNDVVVRFLNMEALMAQRQIDNFLPSFHFQEHHSIHAPVPAHLAYLAAKSLRADEPSRVMHWFFALRSIPSRLGGTPTPAPMLAEKSFLEQMQTNGFLLLQDCEAEIVLGMIGQFWRLSPKIFPMASVQQFVSFNEPNVGKVVANLCFTNQPNGCLIETETRVYTPDSKTRRYFGLYWIIIRLGSGLIRRMWLRAIRKKAIELGRGANCEAILNKESAQ